MEQSENKERISNLGYFSNLVCGRREMILEMIDTFLKQIVEELENLDVAVEKTDYNNIRKVAHSMKSTVSVIGATTLVPILAEIQNLAIAANDIEKIKTLTNEVNIYSNQALKEIELERENYV